MLFLFVNAFSVFPKIVQRSYFDFRVDDLLNFLWLVLGGKLLSNFA